MVTKATSLGERVVAGALAYSGRQMVIMILNAFTGLALTRILTPVDFGYAATISVVVGLGMLFAEGGLGVYLIRKASEITNLEISRIIIIQLTIYVFFHLIVTLLLLSNFTLGFQRLPIYLVWIALFSLPFSLMRSASFILLERSLNFQRISLIEICEQFGFAVIALTMAMCGFGIWSIVLASIARAIIGWLIARRSSTWKFVTVSFRNLDSEFREGLRFGLVYQIPALLETARSAINPFFIGILLGAASAGYIDRAILIAGLPLIIISTACRKVLFPYFAKVKDDITTTRRVFENAVYLHSVLDKAAYFPLIVFGPELIEIILGEKWLSIVPLVYIFVFGNLIFAAFGISCSALIPAIGSPGILAKIAVVQAPIAWLFAIIFVSIFGIIGYPMVSLVLWLFIIYQYIYVKRILRNFRVIIPILKTLIAFIVAGVSTRLIANSIEMGTNLIYIVISLSTFGIGLYLLVLFTIDRFRLVNVFANVYDNFIISKTNIT